MPIPSSMAVARETAVPPRIGHFQIQELVGIRFFLRIAFLRKKGIVAGIDQERRAFNPRLNRSGCYIVANSLQHRENHLEEPYKCRRIP